MRSLYFSMLLLMAVAMQAQPSAIHLIPQPVDIQTSTGAYTLTKATTIGYNKAARVIEILEKRGIITAQIGTKPREILKQL